MHDTSHPLTLSFSFSLSPTHCVPSPLNLTYPTSHIVRTATLTNPAVIFRPLNLTSHIPLCSHSHPHQPCSYLPPPKPHIPHSTMFAQPPSPLPPSSAPSYALWPMARGWVCSWIHVTCLPHQKCAAWVCWQEGACVCTCVCMCV